MASASAISFFFLSSVKIFFSFVLAAASELIAPEPSAVEGILRM